MGISTRNFWVIGGSFSIVGAVSLLYILAQTKFGKEGLISDDDRIYALHKQSNRFCGLRGMSPNPSDRCVCGLGYYGEKCEVEVDLAKKTDFQKKLTDYSDKYDKYTEQYCGKQLSMSRTLTNEDMFKMFDKTVSEGYIKQGMKILDFCGGCGAFKAMLDKRGFKSYFYNVDIGRVPSEFVSKKFDVVSLNVNTMYLPWFEKEYFDFIQISFCLDYIVDTAIFAGMKCEPIRLAFDLIKPGGVIWMPLSYWHKEYYHTSNKIDVKYVSECLKGKNYEERADNMWKFFDIPKTIYPEILYNVYVIKKS